MSAPGRPNVGPGAGAGADGPPSSASQRRSAVRTAVVWEGLRALLDALAQTVPGSGLDVLDVGGGTGGFAVRVAGLGHRVTVVDPNPDALATLGRRSEESGVADRITAVQGELATVPELLGAASVDAVLCHGVLEVVDTPAAAMAALTEVLRPGGGLSLLVSQRHAAVVARAMAGHVAQALELLTAGTRSQDGPHRFTAEETTALLTDAGFTGITLHAVRVFADLVPSSLVDVEPGAAASLAALEHAVAERPEYLSLATQIHAVARLG